MCCYRASAGGVQGNYFAPLGTDASELGISKYAYDQQFNVVYKTSSIYESSTNIPALKSTAASVIDNWSLPNVDFETQGGGTQYFVGDKTLFK